MGTEDENIDCSIIEFLKCQVLARPSPFPHEFLLSIMVILNKGSIHSHSSGEDLNQNRDLPIVLREDFAKVCFETLLQYSLLDQSDPVLTNGNIELCAEGFGHPHLQLEARFFRGGQAHMGSRYWPLPRLGQGNFDQCTSCSYKPSTGIASIY